jgi:two-component system cell cycle response regulator DivK
MKKILVVEDNETNMYLFSRILRKGSYEVIPATNGKEGVETAIRKKPDLILMGIQLTDIDGLEATKRIREAKEGRDIPIVALTSYAMVGDREKALAVGCIGYIEKPINPETFLAEIEKYL